MSKTAIVIWLLLSVVWIGTCVAYALGNWPHMPLDISHTDKGTLDAYNQALTFFLLKVGAAALVPPAIVFGILRGMSAGRS